MRQRYIQDAETGDLIPADEYVFRDRHYVQGEIQPYKSMIDGTMITSRSQHREHLRKHGCVEVGNDIHSMFEHYKRNTSADVSPQKRKELIRAQFDAMSHKEFKAAIKRDIDRVKWSSRER